MIKVVWLILRFAIVYLMLSAIFALSMVINSAHPRPFSLKVDTVVWITIFWFITAYLLVRYETTKEIGKLFFLSILGALVLIIYIDESIWFRQVEIHAWTVCIAVSLALSLLFFIFPHRYLEALVFLLPVSAGSWFLLWAGYVPISMVVEILSNKDTIPAENLDRTIDYIPKMFLTNLTLGVFMVFIYMSFYVLVRWGHNPRRSFQSLTKRLRRTLNAWRLLGQALG